MSADNFLQEFAVLDVTYVLYHENSHFSHLLALLTLSPILLNPAYAVLAVYTREIIFFEMWAGQLACEAFNWVLKHIVKEERPNGFFGPGYGFPSSHSQWMGYFAAFLICHFTFRHRFTSTGSRLLDYTRDFLLYSFILTWAGAVAYSRYHLIYHSARQVLWGVVIGVLFGTSYYTVVEYVPVHFPASYLGRIRTAIIAHPILAWFRLRDGWSVYPDGGTEDQWQAWKSRWDAQQISKRENATPSKAKQKTH
ncbi:PAP2-domain-containing protein [Irpex rosettiformis]|uniref:PAP2-domain-containing protein n=1 Tax=Irpex rosettiformis TaxID=378272 RepID=A0ACB8UAW8_9APHY|nr:PAP2-domain-containing protein [Irpex rosettiformis]